MNCTWRKKRRRRGGGYKSLPVGGRIEYNKVNVQPKEAAISSPAAGGNKVLFKTNILFY